MRGGERRRLRAVLSAAVLLAGTGGGALAQDSDQGQTDTVVTPDRFTKHNWVQTRPDYSYLDGCETGYRTFTFTDDGYFSFNRNVRGHWRINGQSNLRLETKSGQRVTLYFDKVSSLSPSIQQTGGPIAASTGTQIQTTTSTIQTTSTSTNPNNVAALAKPAESQLATPPGHVILVPSGTGALTPIVVPAPSAPAPNTTPASNAAAATTTTNPTYALSASGRLQFRRGDVFTECAQ